MNPANRLPMQLDQILVPFDFSAGAGLAFDEALDLARRYGGKLTLLHAFVLNEQVYPYSAVMTEEEVDEARDAAIGALEEWRDRAEAAGVSIDVRVAPGMPSENIAAVAKEIGADLIVMGTHGRTGLAHVLLGSVTERTLRTAPCPVMAVRPHETPGA
ncbi:MAG: universal stress protein [Deltaproteobacteria bacterium]|nr:universal stress protein [Deltaproteobacteria bacterium]MBW2394662.1 universal stress protein [Deltaproteobacteria bacterium]